MKLRDSFSFVSYVVAGRGELSSHTHTALRPNLSRNSGRGGIYRCSCCGWKGREGKGRRVLGGCMGGRRRKGRSEVRSWHLSGALPGGMKGEEASCLWF